MMDKILRSLKDLVNKLRDLGLNDSEIEKLLRKVLKKELSVEDLEIFKKITIE